MTKVLLMSPLASRDPLSGDTTYTKVLLDDPPPGVEYTTYAEAIDCATMTVRGRRPRHGAFRPLDAILLGVRGLEQTLRGGVMFREPFWYVSLREGAFDLIHQHLFSVCQIGARVPVVSSAGFPLSVLYTEREGWSTARAARAERFDRVYSRATGTHTPGVWAPAGDVMTVYTEYFREYLIATNRPPAAVEVCGQALPDREPQLRPRDKARTVGFVGRDFRRKGGDVAVAAFELLRRAQADVEMVLVTRDPPAVVPKGVELILDPPRDRVLDEILPRIDVLLLPTAGDCGAPYGLLEALQLGIPVVTSQTPWLDERLGPPAVRRVRRTPGAVAEAAATLLDAPPREAARELWRIEFSMPAMHAQLRRAYDLALAS